MKRIKNRLCKIVVATAMILSGCFITQTVEAVDDTRSSGYFDNENLIVSSNEIEGNNSIVIPAESHEPENDEGSNLVGNEGQVWTAKKIDKIDDHGGYKITFYAKGFKYRNVDGSNIKEDDYWKNPLAKGSTLTFAERLPVGDSGNQFTFSGLSVTRCVGLSNKSDIVFKKDNSGNYTISFDANDVKIDNVNEGGLAFDVEVSFLVNLNKNVNAATYQTNTASAKFTPATDNYYYYEWGTRESTEEYYYSGFKWREGSADFGSIQILQNINVPGDKGESNSITFSIYSSNGGSQYNKTNPICTDISTFKQYDVSRYGYPENTPDKEMDYTYWIDVKAELLEQQNINVEENGIKQMYMYLSKVDKKSYYFCIEIQYDNGTWKVFTPKLDLGSGGGCDPDGKYPLEVVVVVEKGKSELRNEYEQYETDTKGELLIPFSNYAKITLILPTADNVSTKKTATLLNWDERTYRIDLYAASKLVQQSKPVDIVFALDLSGSMPWLIDEPQTTISYKNLNTQRNKNDYKIDSTTNSGTISKWQSFQYFVLDGGEYKPIGYFDEENAPKEDSDHPEKKHGAGWYALKSKGRSSSDNLSGAGDIVYNNLVKVDESTNIYVKGNTKTKIEELLDQTQSFIDALDNSSSESTIGFSLYAGTLLGKQELKSVSELTGTGVSDFIGNKKLEGSTSQGVGIQNAQSILKNGNNENKIIILFTDGKEERPSYIDITADNASSTAKDAGIKIYSIGLASQSVLNSEVDQNKTLADKLEGWSSGDGYSFAVSDYTAFEEAFASIFDNFVGSIKKVTIIDTIDSRFIIPSDEISRLNQIDGVTATENTVTWEIDELRYVEDVLKGQHLYIDIKAKEDFLGGNYIPTNVASSSTVSVSGDSEELDDKPVVNVKTIDFELYNGEKTYFLGETIKPEDFVSVLLNDTVSLNDHQMSNLKKGQEITVDYSYENTNDVVGKYHLNYQPNTEDVKLSSHIAEKEGQNVEQYKLTVKYVPLTPEERPQGSYVYTDEDSFVNGSHDSCNHTTNDELKGQKHVATTIDKNGIYSVHVVSGSITINKTINKMTENDTQGDPIFTFHITGTTVSGKTINEYRSVRFESSDRKTEWVATIDDLEKGKYTITELDTIRYEFGSVTDNNADEYKALISTNGKTVTCFIGYASASDDANTDTNKRNVNITYENNLINNKDQSDTDIVTNSFTMKDGKIEISANYYKTSSED